MTTAAEVIVKTLEAAGVRRCYGIPDDTLNHVNGAIHLSGTRWVHVRNDKAAGAEAMLTSELVVMTEIKLSQAAGRDQGAAQ